MKTIRDLDRLRSAAAGAVGIEPAPVTADHFCAGMRLQPSRKAIGRAIRQEVNGSVGFEIDQDGAVSLAFAPRPIVNADGLHSSNGYGWPKLHSPKNRIGTGSHAEAL